MSVAVAIPARLRSSRLPRKVLTDIGGRSLLQRVHEVAVRAGCGPVVILTDADEVAGVARAFGARVLMTDAALQSGTARVASVVDELDADVVVNLQGDAPLTDPDVLIRAASEAQRSGMAVTLPVYRLENPQDVHDPATVKVVRARDGRVLYCSRAAVPFVRDAPLEAWAQRARFWGHAGLYAYTRAFLRSFGDLPASPLEDSERLEQLRWLSAGVAIHSFEVEPQGPSVDTQIDLERVTAALLARAS
ncbi:MAG: 3-deoxy-manno-octulosonate cytidylyltransferase [Solirubrobacterales bacterium]|nr:3-deoxy-manno-octulosonate cytidylyltransferase [Solirubrobacterales bacterium]